MKTAASSARSRSASSKTTNGLLPPSSIENFFRPAVWTMRLPVRGRAGERDRAHVGVRDQRLAGLAAVAVDDVEHAGRDAGLERQLAEARGGQRRQLAHLQHRGVAEREARRDLPGRRHERHVPRARSARRRRPGGRACSSGASASDRCGRRRACTSRRSSGSCRPRAAPVACRSGAITWPVSRVSVSDELGHVRGDQVAEPAHQRGALGWPARRPSAGNAAFAAATAASTSAAPPRATSASTSCVAGLTVSK